MEVPSGKNIGKTINSYKRIINLASIILFSSLFTINTFAQFIDQLTLDNVSASKNTGEKPQSKVWKHDNIWWAVIPTSSGTAGTYIYKLVGTAWVKGLSLSTGTNFKADTKNVGDITYILLFKDGTSKFKTVT